MATQQDQEFEHVHIQHSDGQDTGPGYWPAPTDVEAENVAKKTAKDGGAEKTLRAKPQMTRLAEDDPRFAEWRVKLGILLKQEIAPRPQDGLPWYVEFPRGYWLYERSKHLWVSGYPVKSKLFKSPQEFGLHLLWLMTGSKDYQDCCCIHCNPRFETTGDELTVGDAVNSPTPDQASPAVAASLPKTTKPPTTKAARTSESSTPTTPTPTHTPPVAAATSPVPNHNPPRPIPVLPTDQTLMPFTTGASPVFFRTGELVWFQVAPSWRIGLIARSDYINNQHDILPISHGLFNQSQLQSRHETTLRPFLAFTVPTVSLPDLADKSFDEAHWEAHIRALAVDPAMRERLLLDASKLAAIKISRSFSLFTHLSNTEHGQKANYHGAFLGAERVEVGDALRVRLPPHQNLGPVNLDDALLGLREICTASQMPGTVFFKGDMFVPVVGDQAAHAESASVPADKLPVALAHELEFRTSVAPTQRWRVVMLRQNVVLREGDIRGRFYPSARLLPVLAHPELQQLQAEFNTGVVREAAKQLNQRMDTLKDGYIGQKRNRMDMAGAAVPHGISATFVYEPVVQEMAAEDGEQVMAMV